MDELKELIEYIIAIEFPDGEFTEDNKQFLIEYSINKKPSVNRVLKEIGSEIKSETEYLKKYPQVKALKEVLQDRHNTFISKVNSDMKTGKNAFDRDFTLFLKWWYNQKRECYYCGIRGDVVKEAFESGIIASKKRSFSGTLQIDKKNPDKGYNKDNCVFACVLCNNAKSDMITSEDFKKILAPAFSDYWKEIEKRLKEKNSDK